MRDPLTENVVLLLRGDGLQGGTHFPDDSLKNHVLTRAGTIYTDTSQKVSGSASIYFGGTATHLYGINENLRVEECKWTIEMWIRCVDLSRTHGLISTYSVQMRINTNGSITVRYPKGAGEVNKTTSPDLIKPATWHHIALCATETHWQYGRWTGNDYRLYVDGINAMDIDDSATGWSSSETLYIGRATFGGTNYRLQGHLDLFRFTRGINRYPTNFTPPTIMDDCTPMNATTQLITSL